MVHGNANPSLTHQPSHGDCSPLWVWTSTAYEIQPLFPDFGAVWGGKCFGVDWFPAGCSGSVCGGRVAHPAWDSFQGEAAHKAVLRDPAMALAAQNPSPATQDYPKLMTACLEMEMCSFQACSTSQGRSHSNPRAAPFTMWHEILVSPELLTSLPRLFWKAAVNELLRARLLLSPGQCLWSRRFQILEVTHYLGTWPTALDLFSIHQPLNHSPVVFFSPPKSRRLWVLKKRGLFYKLNTVLLYFRLWYTVYTIN